MLAEVPLLNASGEGRGCDLTPRLKPFLALISTTGRRYEVYRHAWKIKKKQKDSSFTLLRMAWICSFSQGGGNTN